MNKPATRGFSDLCASLTELTPAELEQVRLRAAFLSGGSAASPAALDDVDDDWLLRGIGEELKRRGVTGSARMQADQVDPRWREKSAQLRADLVRAHGGTVGARTATALGRMVARALADWLVAARVPLGPRTMLKNVGSAWVAIEEAFPGYVEAGMLRCCLDPELIGMD